MKYHFDKNFIPSHSLQEQLEALKEKLPQAPTPEQPFDDDDLDEVDHELPETRGT